MPALTRADVTGTVAWLGRVPDRAATLRAEPVTEVFAAFAGFEGEAHGGLTRPACSRFSMLHPRGTEIRNSRQLSILSVEELAEVAAALGLDALDPALIGSSLVLEGIPDLSHLPPSSRLQSPAGTTLAIDLENGPCQLAAREIETDAPGCGKGFVPAARGRRGVTAWVEREGPLKLGDALALFVPTQRAWAGIAAEAAE